MSSQPADQGAEVLVERDGAILVITINRPSQRNAVNAAVSAGVADALDVLDGSPELRVGVIQGAGDTFCAGMDLKAFANGEAVRHQARGFAGIVERPPAKPLIAAVEGWAVGGGFEIVLCCDLVVAASSAKFGLPEVRRGLAARGGGLFRLPQRIPRSIAMELILTGRALDADRAASLGFVNVVTAPGQATQHARKLGREIADNAPLAVQASKRVALAAAGWPAEEGFVRQREYLEPVFGSSDAAEGVAAFRERRDPVWRGK